jgi:hypothetical protein
MQAKHISPPSHVTSGNTHTGQTPHLTHTIPYRQSHHDTPLVSCVGRALLVRPLDNFGHVLPNRARTNLVMTRDDESSKAVVSATELHRRPTVLHTATPLETSRQVREPTRAFTGKMRPRRRGIGHASSDQVTPGIWNIHHRRRKINKSASVAIVRRATCSGDPCLRIYLSSHPPPAKRY